MNPPHSAAARPRSHPPPTRARLRRTAPSGRIGRHAHAPGRRARTPGTSRRHPRFPAVRPPRPARLNTVCAVAVVAAVLLTVAGRAVGRVWAFLDFGAGVLALVCLTAATLWGLAAGDRTLLGPEHRLLAQGVHRGTAVAGLGFLALHVWVKVAAGSTAPAAAVAPFTDDSRPFLIGLGTVSGWLFTMVAATGAARSVFAARRRSRWWRALHMCAYPAWGTALVHGLKSGRSASGWVTTAYVLCTLAVAAGLTVRLCARRDAAAGPGGDTPGRPR